MRIACIFVQYRQDEELRVGQGKRELDVKEIRRGKDGKFCPAPRESMNIIQWRGARVWEAFTHSLLLSMCGFTHVSCFFFWWVYDSQVTWLLFSYICKTSLLFLYTGNVVVTLIPVLTPAVCGRFIIVALTFELLVYVHLNEYLTIWKKAIARTRFG